MKQLFMLFAALLLSLTLACSSGQKNTATEQQPGEGGTNTSSQAGGTQAGAASLSTQDKEFVQFANQANKSEVELAKLASDKSKNKDVKDFAKSMQDDHDKANDKLKDIADNKGVTLPDQVLPDAAQLQDQLGKETGTPKFDKTYIESEVKDHRMVINKFQDEVQNGQDADVKAYAQQVLPNLQQHLKHAEDVAKKLGVKIPPEQNAGETSPSGTE
jgi:putative membrane protein